MLLRKIRLAYPSLCSGGTLYHRFVRHYNDTIFALSSGSGKSAIAVIHLNSFSNVDFKNKWQTGFSNIELFA